MINDIERFDFWNREADEFIRRENIKKKEILMRWDSCTNKVPFICSIDVAVKDSPINVYPTGSLLST
jgi:hypothetical protein